MKMQMDKTTDTFIIVKSGQDATPPGGEQFSGVPGKRGGEAGVRCAPAAGIQSGLVPGGWGYVGEENFRLLS